MNKKNKKRLWPWVMSFIIILLGLWQFFSNNYKEEEKELRTQIRKTVKEMFPETKKYLELLFNSSQGTR